MGEFRISAFGERMHGSMVFVAMEYPNLDRVESRAYIYNILAYIITRRDSQTSNAFIACGWERVVEIVVMW